MWSEWLEFFLCSSTTYISCGRVFVRLPTTNLPILILRGWVFVCSSTTSSSTQHYHHHTASTFFFPLTSEHVRIRNYHLRGFSFAQRSRHETLAELLLEELSHDLLHGHCAVVLNRQHQWVPFKRQSVACVCKRQGVACMRGRKEGCRACVVRVSNPFVNFRMSCEFVDGAEHESEKCSLTLYPACRVHAST